VGAWALVEIPRYLFYAAALNAKGSHQINSALFFLRYHLFLVLYPAGITGELLLMYAAYNGLSSATLFARVVLVHHLVYVPMAPFMILNMWRNKKRAYSKRAKSANPRPVTGLSWPITKGTQRGTTATNRAIWAASTKKVDAKGSARCQGERNWRFKYQKHVMDNVVTSCRSKANALSVARDGLDAAYKVFEFIRDGKTLPFSQAMAEGTFKGSFQTHIVRGEGGDDCFSETLSVPYGGGAFEGRPYFLGLEERGRLEGLALKTQLAKWVEYGSIEQSAADAIAAVATKKGEWLDLRDSYFILLGATSAMGPLFFLLEHGANVIAVDLDRDFIWKKLFAAVANSRGSLILPVRGDADPASLSQSALERQAGCNLLSDTPEIANWLCEVVRDTVPQNKRVTIGNYTYLDGALHVQLALACDGIIDRVCRQRKDTNIAFLCTPTDDHVVTTAAFNASKDSFKRRAPGWATTLNAVVCGKLLGKPNYAAMRKVDQERGEALYVIDGIAVAQGPNYALAKRLQHWRAVLAFSDGHVVSSNVAPSTATESVVHNAQFAAAYGGMHHFAPMEVMYQRTSLAVMGALLVHDIMNAEGAANPKSEVAKAFRNPFELFAFGSFHGGVQRCSFKINEIGVPSALAFYVTQYKVPMVVGLVNLVLGAKWLTTGSLF